MNKWQLPPINLLDQPKSVIPADEWIRYQINHLEKSLANLGVPSRVREINESPGYFKFHIEPEPRISITQIERVRYDLSVALSDTLEKIEMPTTEKPFVGILIKNPHKSPLQLHPILTSQIYRRKKAFLKIGLGLDTSGTPMVIDLTELPHLLIGGTTNSGKSVCLRTIIANFLCAYTPDELKFLMIDLKEVELNSYKSIPHLLHPIINQPDTAISVLDGLDSEISDRFAKFATMGVKDIATYNVKVNGTGKDKMPYVVILIDNIYDLMELRLKDFGEVVKRIANRARAAGVHMILSTQRAKTDIVSGAIKINFPGRIAFRVTDVSESKLILDTTGAQKLSSPGEFLFKSPSVSTPKHIQGAIVTEHEMRNLIDYWDSVSSF